MSFVELELVFEAFEGGSEEVVEEVGHLRFEAGFWGLGSVSGEEVCCFVCDFSLLF